MLSSKKQLVQLWQERFLKRKKSCESRVITKKQRAEPPSRRGEKAPEGARDARC
jgi:hypothetical protein